VDAPQDQGVDAPAPDGPVGDGTVTDAPLDAPASDGVVNVDISGDFTPLYDAGNDSGVVGQNDAGQYLCLTYGGVTVVCQCNDGLDNDGDKKTDFPNDPGCTAAWDHNELDGSTQCTDTIDNDGDGKIDAADPDCTGMLDDDESSFGSGIPGDNIDCTQDCFFDGNSGSGNDDCIYSIKCDPKNPAQYLDPPQKNCTYDSNMLGGNKCPTPFNPGQTQQCLDFCLPITPNGCDCFGCCAIPYSTDAGVGEQIVMLRDTCKAKPDGTVDPALLLDPTKCVPCTQVPDCLNTCGKCEVCIGKPLPDPSCFPSNTDGGPVGDGGSGGACPPGIIYCGPGGIPPDQCPPGTYCVTGCCVWSDG